MFKAEARKSVFEKHGNDIEVFLTREQHKFANNEPSDFGIFRHQIDAPLKTMHFLNNRTATPALLILPTGSGKTGVLSLIPYLMRSKRTMVLTPSPVISQQIKTSFALSNNPLNFFQKTSCFSGWTDDEINGFLPRAHLVKTTDEIGKVEDDLVIVNAQKFGGNSRTNVGWKEGDPDIIARIEAFFKDCDLLIVDEAHHFPAATWVRVCNAFKARNPNGHLVFITATVERMLDGKKQRFLPPRHDAFVITEEQLMEDILRPLEVVNLPQRQPRSESVKDDLVRQVFRILAEHDQKEDRFQHQALIAVGKDCKERKKAVAVAGDIANLFNKFRPGSARAITGGMHARKDDVKDFRERKFPVAVVCQMLVEGFDNPSISLCVVFKKVGSRPWLCQFLGRCRRQCRPLSGGSDRTTATFLTYQHFGLDKHINAMKLNVVAEEGDGEEDDEEDFIENLLASSPRN